MSATTWPFITRSDAGLAMIAGTRTKVIEVALDHLAYGWDADQIHRQHPYLSLPQIHAALGFYHDNRDECDAQIEERRKLAEQLRNELENPELQRKLRAASARQ